MGDIYTNPPQSRNEAILRATIDGTEYTAPPQSRIEDLLLELKEAIEQGGAGEGDMEKSVYDADNAVATAGGIAAYVDDEITDLHLGTASTKNSTSVVTQSTDLVESGAVYDALGFGNKNLLPITLKYLKSINTVGTWSGNQYTYQNKVYTVIADNNGIVQRIDASGTATATSTFYLLNVTGNESFIGSNVILNGCPSDGTETTYRVTGYRLTSKTGSTGTIYDYGSGVQFDFLNDASETAGYIAIQIFTGGTGNYSFYPMLRYSTITDGSYEPYYPSVKDTLRDAEVIEGENFCLGIPLELGTISAQGGDSDNNARVRTKLDKKIKFNESREVIFTFSGNASEFAIYQYDSASTDAGSIITGGWVSSGYTFTPNSSKYFRLVFKKADGSAMSVSDVQNLVARYNYLPLKEAKMSYADNGVLGAKQFIPLSLEIIKELNSGRTWNGNSCFHNGITFTVNVDSKGSVTSISTSGTSTAFAFLRLASVSKLSGSFKLNGGISTNVFVYIQNETTSTQVARSETGDVDVNLSPTNDIVNCIVGINPASGGTNTIYPMLRLATDTDPTFALYSKTNIQLTQDKADNSVIAPTENAATVQKSGGYAVGTHAIRNGAFITWNVAKAQGETINDASDYTAGDVADELDTVDITSQCTFSPDCTWTIDWCKVIKRGNVIDMCLRFVTPTVVTANKAIITLPDNITFFGATVFTPKYLGIASHDWNKSAIAMINISPNSDVYLASDTWTPNTGCVFHTTFISNK